jgi:hypothetical protein
VRGTLGEKNRTINVVIDSVACYSAEIYYPIEVITDFAKKESNWTESGGTMRYGNGVYVNRNDTKGTITTSEGVLVKYVDIPCYVKNFDFSFIAYNLTSNYNAERGFYVSLLGPNDEGLLTLLCEDWWGVSDGQVWRVGAYEIGSYDYSYGGTTYNGIDIPCRFVYDGSQIDYYFADATPRTYQWEAPSDIVKIRIGFTASASTSNPMSESRVKNMKLLAL